jgi:phage-related tail protein
MYWDCMFIAAMYFEQGVPPLDDNTTEDAVRQALKIAIDGFSKPQKAVEDALQEIVALLQTLNDPVGAVGDELEKKAKAVEQVVTNPGAAAEKKKEELKEIIEKPVDAVKDPVGTLKKLSPF